MSGDFSESSSLAKEMLSPLSRAVLSSAAIASSWSALQGMGGAFSHNGVWTIIHIVGVPVVSTVVASFFAGPELVSLGWEHLFNDAGPGSIDVVINQVITPVLWTMFAGVSVLSTYNNWSQSKDFSLLSLSATLFSGLVLVFARSSEEVASTL